MKQLSAAKDAAPKDRSKSPIGAHTSGTSSGDGLAALHDAIGNRGTARLLARITTAPLATQRRGAPGLPLTGVSLDQRALRALGAGQRTEQTIRAPMEAGLGVDLSDVRIHTNPGAARAAPHPRAEAFASGQDSYFGTDRYRPDGGGESELALPMAAMNLGQEVIAQPPAQHTDLSQYTKARGVRVERPPAPPRVPTTPVRSLSIQQSAGNIAIKRLFDPGQRNWQESSISPAMPGVGEGVSKESGIEQEQPKDSVTSAQTPATPEDDPAYQAVIKQLEVKAKRERTPTKTAKQKQDETVMAANLPVEIPSKEKAYGADLDKLADAPQFTTDAFMEEFNQTIEKLSKTIHDENGGPPQGYEAWDNKREQTASELAGPTLNHGLKKQNETTSEPYLTPTVEKVSDQVLKENQGPTSALKLDPVGSTPALQQARTAAPKPKTEKSISLDEQSRALDDALVGHNIGGRIIDIEEASLAFPVSGEISFEEAVETKRIAQHELLRARPRYREQEAGLITKAEGEMHSLVNTTALQGHHARRAESFKGVLDKQEYHGGNIKKEKITAFSEFETIYEKTKKNVAAALKKIDPDAIEKKLSDILTAAEAYFASSVRTQLEYIYTPGHLGLDYSDWIDEHAVEVAEETEKFKKAGEDPISAHLKGLIKVQDRSAAKFFEIAKESFIRTVKQRVEQEIAPMVVAALQEARISIATGRADVQAAYDRLHGSEKVQAKQVLEAVQGKFQSLEESVAEAQHEVITDMARTYNQSVGKLQSKFDEIKKDVLTSWLEKAWNKLKAVVNAIIEFATRIAQLLGRVVYLLGDIVSSPRAFFTNLITGISEGFATFVGRIDEFLATAFFDWIRGTSGVQVQLPKEWNPAGIFSLFTQLLNLSIETIWQRMEVVYDKSVANAFRQGEVVIERGLEIFNIIKKEGLGGLWDHIVDSLGTLLSDTLDEIKETVLYAAIKKVIIEIGKMLVPGGGFIAIAEKIIRLLAFIVEARNKILDLIEAFVTSMENAAKGDIAGIVQLITTALTRFITVALDFLVSFFGLSSLKEKIARFIERMRSPVIRGIDFVLQKFKPLVMRGKEVLLRAEEKVVGTGQRVGLAVRGWLGLEKKFVANDGMEHEIYFAGGEANPILMIRSHPNPFSTFIESVEVGSDERKKTARELALAIARDIDAKRLEALEGSTEEDKRRSREKKALEVEKLLDKLSVPTTVLFGGPLAVGEPEILNTPQAAGYGVTMTALRLNKKQKVKGSRPTSARNSSFEILNRRRQEGNPEVAYYMKGHLLNEDLGGVGNWENLTPLSRKGNSDHESQVEALVKAAFQSGVIIEYNVTARYGYGQNAGEIPADDPEVVRKKRVIQEEVNVPKTLACEAFVLDKLENGILGRKQTILKTEIANQIGQSAASYSFSDTPVRDIIYLADADEKKIATIEGIDSKLAWKIVVAHKELRNSSRFNSYEELSDARDFAGDRIFPVEPEQEAILALEEVKYVRLYKGAGGGTATGIEAEENV